MGSRHDRDELLEAGVELVLEEGIAALTFGRLAKRLDISDRMVVYYFVNKDVLISEVAAVMGGRLQVILEEAFDEKAPASEMLRLAWPLLANSRVDPLMAVYFEVVGLATAKKDPFVALASTLVEGWVTWLAGRLPDGTAAERRRVAHSIIATIDGLLMVRQVCGARAANDAARVLGIAD